MDTSSQTTSPLPGPISTLFQEAQGLFAANRVVNGQCESTSALMTASTTGEIVNTEEESGATQAGFYARSYTCHTCQRSFAYQDLGAHRGDRPLYGDIWTNLTCGDCIAERRKTGLAGATGAENSSRTTPSDPLIIRLPMSATTSTAQEEVPRQVSAPLAAPSTTQGVVFEALARSHSDPSCASHGDPSSARVGPVPTHGIYKPEADIRSIRPRASKAQFETPSQRPWIQVAYIALLNLALLNEGWPTTGPGEFYHLQTTVTKFVYEHFDLLCAGHARNCWKSNLAQILSAHPDIFEHEQGQQGKGWWRLHSTAPDLMKADGVRSSTMVSKVQVASKSAPPRVRPPVTPTSSEPAVTRPLPTPTSQGTLDVSPRKRPASSPRIPDGNKPIEPKPHVRQSSAPVSSSYSLRSDSSPTPFDKTLALASTPIARETSRDPRQVRPGPSLPKASIASRAASSRTNPFTTLVHAQSVPSLHTFPSFTDPPALNSPRGRMKESDPLSPRTPAPTKRATRPVVHNDTPVPPQRLPTQVPAPSAPAKAKSDAFSASALPSAPPPVPTVNPLTHPQVFQEVCLLQHEWLQLEQAGTHVKEGVARLIRSLRPLSVTSALLREYRLKCEAGVALLELDSLAIPTNVPAPLELLQNQQEKSSPPSALTSLLAAPNNLIPTIPFMYGVPCPTPLTSTATGGNGMAMTSPPPFNPLFLPYSSASSVYTQAYFPSMAYFSPPQVYPPIPAVTTTEPERISSPLPLPPASKRACRRTLL